MKWILPECYYYDHYADYYTNFISNPADEIVTTTADTNNYEDTTIINGTDLIQTTTKGKLSTIRCKFPDYLKINKKMLYLYNMKWHFLFIWATGLDLNCTCDRRGKQNGGWCWLEKSPCRLLTGNMAPSNITWVTCEHNGAMLIDCPGNKIFVYCNHRMENLAYFKHFLLST